MGSFGKIALFIQILSEPRPTAAQAWPRLGELVATIPVASWRGTIAAPSSFLLQTFF